MPVECQWFFLAEFRENSAGVIRGVGLALGLPRPTFPECHAATDSDTNHPEKYKHDAQASVSRARIRQTRLRVVLVCVDRESASAIANAIRGLPVQKCKLLWAVGSGPSR